MKKRSFIIVLLVIVAAIWYNVFLRVKSTFTENSENYTIESNKEIKYHYFKPNPFSLTTNFRDPFLSNVSSITVSETKDISTNKTIDLAPKKNEVYWSDIKYFGFVRNVTANKPTAIISVDDYIFKIKVGESILDNIKLLAANQDEIKMSYKGKIKFFYK